MKTSEVIKLLGVRSNDMYKWLTRKNHGILKDGGRYAWDEAAVEKARAHFSDKGKLPDPTFKSPGQLFNRDAMTYIRGRTLSRQELEERRLAVETPTETKPKPVDTAVYAYTVNSVMNHMLMDGRIPPHADPHVALRDSLIDALLSVTRVLIERK